MALSALLCLTTTGAMAQTTWKVSVKEDTEDASNWQGKAGEGEYQALPLEGVAAGTAVSVKYNGTKRVKSVKAVKKVKRVATVTAPTAVAASLTYSGSAQTLFSAGSTTGGTMKYKVTTTNSKPASTADFKTTIDQGTNAGTYYLWYYVDGGDDYNTTDVNGTAVTKAIGKAAASVTAPTAVAASRTYSGSAQTLFSAGSTTGGTMKYKVTTTNSKPASTADFKTTIDQGTNAGTYYLWYYVDGGDDYNTTDVNGTAVTKAIAQAAATLTCNNSAISFSSSDAMNSTKTKTGVSCNGGTIKVTSANTGNCTVSYSGGTITVTRKNNSAFTNTQITVSVTPDSNHTAPGNVTFNVSAEARPASSATSSDKGKLIGRDGKIYDNTTVASNAGTTAEAKIIYVGNSTGDSTYTHGLALALSDEVRMMDWNAADSACNAKNTSTSKVNGAKWLLASEAQWNTMITAAGSYTALRDGFSGISGASNLQSANYWSITKQGSKYAKYYSFASGTWDNYGSKTSSYWVRACLAF